MKVCELPPMERPREKALAYGIDSLSSRELLAILIRSGYQGKSTLQIADDLLNRYGLEKLPGLSLADITQIKGLKKTKALELLACFEISKRILAQRCFDVDVINNPDMLVRWLRQQIGFSTQEHFMVVFLNAKNHVIAYKTLFIGSLDASIAHPREIFKEAMVKSAARIIAVHNHPSGDATPSPQDLELTKVLIEAGKLVGIPLIDHVIVGRTGFASIMHNLK